MILHAKLLLVNIGTRYPRQLGPARLEGGADKHGKTNGASQTKVPASEKQTYAT